jgi:hypothetical protein
MLRPTEDDMRIQSIYIDQVAVAHALTSGMVRLGRSRARPLWRVKVGEHALQGSLLQCGPLRDDAVVKMAQTYRSGTR